MSTPVRLAPVKANRNPKCNANGKARDPSIAPPPLCLPFSPGNLFLPEGFSPMGGCYPLGDSSQGIVWMR